MTSRTPMRHLITEAGAEVWRRLDYTVWRRLDYTASRTPDDRRSEGVTKDVAFNRMSFENGRDGYVTSPSDNGHVEVGTDGIEVRLVQDYDDETFRYMCSLATKATQGIDLNEPVDELDWFEMLKGGLQTALEDFRVAFAVSGVSRACTHQLVRTRKAAFHQQSMRAHYYGERPEFRIPESVWASPRAREAFVHAMATAHWAYWVACSEDVSYQDARFILPEGTTNFILLEYDLREFMNVYAYRGCSMFQWEIVHVMRECRRLLVEAHPYLEPYIKISCEKTNGARDADQFRFAEGDIGHGEALHTCTFQGWEAVEGQCDFPWARETNRQFRSDRHAITRRRDNYIPED